MSTKKGIATVAQAAAMDFEPWDHERDEWVPPSNEEWLLTANGLIVTLRVAWRLLYKTKPELMKIIEDIDDEAGTDLMDTLRRTNDLLKGLHAIVDGAESRLICAGAAVIQKSKRSHRQPRTKRAA